MAVFPWTTGRRRRCWAGSIACVVEALLFALGPAGANTAQTGEFDFTTSASPYAITAYNENGAAGSDSIFAVAFAAGAKAVYGYTADSSTSDAPSFGVAGISQNGYGVYGSSYAAGVSAIYGENASTGVGVQGDSAQGDGVIGVGHAVGVYGETLAARGPVSAGVFGMDGASGGGQAYGIFGETTTNAGVYGYATGAGVGVYAYSRSGTSLVAFTPATGGAAYLGTAAGIGVSAIGYSGSATYPALATTIKTAGTDLFGAYGLNGETFIVQGTSADNSGAVRPVASGGASDVQISGDLFVYGKVYTDCNAFPVTSPSNCSAGPYAATSRAVTANGALVQTYVAKQTLPTVEDVGSSELQRGVGIVRIDPAFAATMAQHSAYHVFLTAKGDSRGLYVQGETPAGFVVRENQGGRSTLSFDYRIVAMPLDASTAGRLMVVPAKTDRSPLIATYRAPAKPSLAHPAATGPAIARPPRIAAPSAAQLRLHGSR